MPVLPVAEIPRLAASELRVQLARLIELEIVVGKLAPSAVQSASSDQLAILQEFDRLSQSLNALVAYLDHASTAITTDATVDTGPAIRAMTLRDMADRLTGTPPRASRVSVGIDLF